MIRVNLLGLPKPKKRVPVVTLEGGRSLIILGVVLLVVVVVQYVRYGQLQKKGEELAQSVQKLQTDKARLQGIKSEYDKFLAQKELLTKRINIIEGLKAKQSGPTRLLDMLASTVSNTDSLWLTNFEQAGQKITIEGVALNANAVANFLSQLLGTKALSDMDLKETFEDAATKDLQRFIFTVNGLLATPPPTT